MMMKRAMVKMRNTATRKKEDKLPRLLQMMLPTKKTINRMKNLRAIPLARKRAKMWSLRKSRRKETTKQSPLQMTRRVTAKKPARMRRLLNQLQRILLPCFKTSPMHFMKKPRKRKRSKKRKKPKLPKLNQTTASIPQFLNKTDLKEPMKRRPFDNGKKPMRKRKITPRWSALLMHNGRVASACSSYSRVCSLWPNWTKILRSQERPLMPFGFCSQSF
mmetsp:Transcript_26516/g.55484  ORF Transcript_26516/g.55484 Transcript_26516/m.55484 type:complete len:218 (+) Transcript_26516:269-922(+)